MNVFHTMYGAITVTAPTNKASNTYIADLTRQTQPYAYDHTKYSTTWYKVLPIKFQLFKIECLLKSLGGNAELQSSFTKILNVGECSDVQAKILMREHVYIVLKQLYPLVKEMLDVRITEFVKFGYHRFRLTVDENHPFHQRLEETFPAIRDFVENEQMLIDAHNSAKANAKRARVNVEAIRRASNVNNNTHGKRKGTDIKVKYTADSVEELITRRRQANTVKDQDAYRSYVMFQTRRRNFPNQSSCCLPPFWVLNNVLLSEEDGRSQSYLEWLAKIDQYICAIIYNMPYQYERVATYISSGSITQSASINSVASPLEMIMCPLRARDVENTQVWQSEFFRRSINDFKSAATKAYRSFCETIEKNVPPDRHSFIPLLFRENHTSLIIDPAHVTDGLRFFYLHDDVISYNKSMECTRERTQTCISDLLFVTSDIVLLNIENLKRTNDPDNPYGISMVGLSTLNKEEALENRARLWMRKRKIINELKRFYQDRNTSINMIATGRKSTLGPNLHELSEDKYSSIMRNFCNTEDEKRSALDDKKNQKCSDEIESLFTADVVKDIQFEEYTNRAGRPKTYTRRQNAMTNKTGADIANGATLCMDFDEGTDDDESEDQVTKICVSGPANLMLSREEHMERRIYANSIRDHLGTGKALAKLTLSTRGQDHEGEFVYSPQHDILVEYAQPDWDMLGKRDSIGRLTPLNWKGFKKSIAQTSSGSMMHLLFKRHRKFTEGGKVTDEGTRTHLKMRGVHSTIKIVTESHWVNHVVPRAFSMLVMAGLIDVFRRWILTETLACDVTLMNHTHRDCDELIDAILKETTDGIDKRDLQIVMDYRSVVYEHTKRSDDHVKTSVNLQLLLETFTRWLVEIRERHVDFSQNYNLTIYVEDHPLYRTVEYELETLGTVPLTSFFGADIHLFGNGFHKATEIERSRLHKRVPSLKEQSKYSEYGSESYYERKGLMKSVSNIIDWTARSWFPDLMFDVMGTVLIDHIIIATNVPRIAKPIKWSALFTNSADEKKNKNISDRFGFMTRSQSASIKSLDSNLFHQLFRMKVGELDNYPRPFQQGGSSPQSCTNIIVKTDSAVYPYAKQPRLRINEGGKINKITYITAKEFDHLSHMDLQVSKIETSATIPFMCPFVIHYSCTVDSIQGQSCPGPCMMDLSLVTRDRYLIALTRATDIRNVFVSNVQNAMTEAEETCTEKLKLNMLKKRSQRAITAKWEHFR